MLFVAAVSYKSWLLLIRDLGRWRGSKRPGVANLLRLPGNDSHFANATATTLLNLAEVCIANMLLSQSKPPHRLVYIALSQATRKSDSLFFYHRTSSKHPSSADWNMPLSVVVHPTKHCHTFGESRTLQSQSLLMARIL
jgi:hypothetical protein